MNRIFRLYPLRLSREKWVIPLYCFEKCNKDCDKHCKKLHYYEKTHINMATYDDGKSLNGKLLYDPEMTVIPSSKFSVSIYFPLTRILNVSISTLKNGFTLHEVIKSIKTLYEHIYVEEEQTATPAIYSIKKECDGCKDVLVGDCVEDISTPKSTDDCCICYEESKKDCVNLLCGHVFHRGCITQWIKDVPTCPICRSGVYSCVNCDGTGVIKYTYQGIVIPTELRGDGGRNYTDGRFGIYGYDYEDLCIDHMYYVKSLNRVFMRVIPKEFI